MKKIFLALIFGFILFIFLTITLAVMVVPVKAYTGSTIGSEEETVKVYMPMVLSPMGRTSRNTVSVPVTVPTPTTPLPTPEPTVPQPDPEEPLPTPEPEDSDPPYRWRDNIQNPDAPEMEPGGNNK